MHPNHSGEREAGFTLVELLVVIVIVGLLAAIAIPAFFGQSAKGRDAGAKMMARTAETAIEAYAAERDGSYAGATPADLHALEPTIDASRLGVTDVDGAGSPRERTYRVTVASPTGNSFWVARADSGIVTLGCAAAGNEGCPVAGRWG